MSNTICYTPVKGVDDVLASLVPGWNSYFVATLRGMYDESHETSTRSVEVLQQYLASLNEEDNRKFTDAILNPVAAYTQLREVYNAQEMSDRYHMIADYFSDAIDAIQNDYPNVDREDIIRGFINENGEFDGGPAKIFEEVSFRLQDERDEWIEDGHPEIANKINTIFDNWGALITYANTVIRDNEGISVSNKLVFAKATDDSNYASENVQSFTMEESTKEAWQEMTESISPFGSTNIRVKRLLGRLHTYDEKDTSNFDDLGHPRRESGVHIHQQLMDVLRGIQSESDLVTALKANAETYPYVNEILDRFEEDSILRTQFFIDFSKVFQLYSMQKEENNGGQIKYSNPTLNTVRRKDSYNAYKARIFSKKSAEKGSIFSINQGIVSFDKESALALADFIEKNLGKTDSPFDKFGTAEFKSREAKIDFYKAVLPLLGFDLTQEEYNVLATNNKYISKINRAIKELPDGLRRAEQANAKKFSEALDKTFGNASEGYLAEKIGKIAQITEGLSRYKRVLSRVRFHENTYFSDVQSSYLGRFMNKIQAISKEGNKKALEDFITSNFLGNHFFKEENKSLIRARWVRELFESNLKDENSFANNITYKKFLGDDISGFEDFGTKKQAITLINEYNAESSPLTYEEEYEKLKKKNDELPEDRRKPIVVKPKYAWYPVFVLGDSGASKYIKAPKYSEKDIVDEMYQVYLQEKTLQRELKEVKMALTKAGKSLGSLAKIDDNKFGHLVFLNDSKYSSMIDSNDIENSVKKAIREYLNDSFAAYKIKLRNCGALKMIGKGDKAKYKYMAKLFSGKEAHTEELLDKRLRDYFVNTKFATIMQMEMTTISPIFYKNGDSTDLQKRYKEIHASGNRISIEAINPFTHRPFSERNYQTTLYFNDVKVNPEETNKEFMEVIKAVYGENSEVYKTYRDDTSFTDGQGYRTLDSYRAVMGMAGKWNRKCEDAYNKLKVIQLKVRASGELTKEDTAEIEGLMAVFQPIKPFMYTLEEIGLGNSIFQVPNQMKYAEILVIPELLPKGSKLRDIMEYAEDNDIDVVAATTTTKAVQYGAVDVKSATSKEGLINSLSSATIHQLSYNDYIIQTNVPEHMQGSQLFATQCRKLIFSGLKMTDETGAPIYYDNYVGSDKVCLGERDSEGNYTTNKVSGINLNKFYISLIAANILEDFDKYVGTIKDPEKVRQALVQMTINNNRESKDNLRGYNEGIESDFLMPLYEGGIEYDTAALLLSMFRKQVNKQKINGGSAVQASAFGIEGYNEDNNLKFVKDPNNPNNILYCECEIPWDLKYTDSQGKEVELNFNDWCDSETGKPKLGRKLEKSDSKYNEYQSYKDKEGNVHIPLIEEEFPGILSFVAYRIPTEAKYSMLNMRVVRFTHKVNGGGVIKVPAQGTTIAGFDFDIDKLYFMRYEFKYRAKYNEAYISREDLNNIWATVYDDNPGVREALEAIRSIKAETDPAAADKSLNSFWGEDSLTSTLDKNELFEDAADILGIDISKTKEEYLENYNFNKPAWDKSQTRTSRNNMLIRLIQKRLEDPDTIEDRTTPGGFKHASKAAKYLRELMGIENINYDYSDPWTMIVYNQQNQVAGKLIGIFANQNTNNALASLLDTFALSKPIAFGNHTSGLSNLKNPAALTKELLAASVDAVKDPVLNFLNLNTITADSAGMLCRLGYSFEEIGLLMNQPGIRRLCDYMMDNNMSDVDTAINNVLKEMQVEGDYSKDTNVLTSNMLESQIVAFRDAKEDWNSLNQEFIENQAKALELFRSIYASAKDVSEFVTNTKFTASNAVKSTFGGMYAQQDRVKRYVKNIETSKNPRVIIKVNDFVGTPITLGLNMSEKDSYMQEVLNNPFGYEQVMYDANIGAVNALCKYFPYNKEVYQKTREFMNSLTKSGLDEESIDAIHQYMLNYLIGNYEDSDFNPDKLISFEDKDYDAKSYYLRIFPRIFVRDILTNEDLVKQYPILQMLTFEKTTDKDSKDNKEITVLRLMDVGGLTETQKEQIRESWESLMDNPQLREQAFNLYKYSYYQSGFGFGVYGFNHLAPLSLKLALMVDEDTSYLDFLNNIMEGEGASMFDVVSFAKKFISNHRDNKRLVYQPKMDQAQFFRGKCIQNGIYSSEVTLDFSKGDSKVAPFMLNKKEQIFKPAIIIDNRLYIANGPEFNKSTDGTMTYVYAPKHLLTDISDEEFIKYESNNPNNTSNEEEVVEAADSTVETSDTTKKLRTAKRGRVESNDDSNENSTGSSSNIEGEPVETVEVQANGVVDLMNKVVEVMKSNNKLIEPSDEAAWRVGAIKLLAGVKDTSVAQEELTKVLIEEYQEKGVHCKLNGKPIC